MEHAFYPDPRIMPTGPHKGVMTHFPGWLCPHCSTNVSRTIHELRQANQVPYLDFLFQPHGRIQECAFKVTCLHCNNRVQVKCIGGKWSLSKLKD